VSSKKASPHDSDNDQQLEVAIWPPKPDMLGQPYCYFRLSVVVAIICEHFELAMAGKLHFVSAVTTILILDLICKIVNMITKFRQFKKNFTCLTSCLTASSAQISDLVVLFCMQSIPKRSHKKALPYAKQEFFMIHKLRWGSFLPPSAIRWF